MPPASGATRSLADTPIARLVTDGTVFATAAAGGRTYVGGDFSLIGHASGSWVAVAPSGEALADRPLVDGFVNGAALFARSPDWGYRR